MKELSFFTNEKTCWQLQLSPNMTNTGRHACIQEHTYTHAHVRPNHVQIGFCQQNHFNSNSLYLTKYSQLQVFRSCRLKSSLKECEIVHLWIYTHFVTQCKRMHAQAYTHAWLAVHLSSMHMQMLNMVWQTQTHVLSAHTPQTNLILS